MFIITQQACENLLGSAGIPISAFRELEDWPKSDNSKASFVWVDPNVDHFKAFVEAILSESRSEKHLVWIQNENLWPTADFSWLFYLIRRTHGCFQSIGEYPGHLCMPWEREELASLLAVAILSRWDIVIFPTSGWHGCFFSHDGWLKIWEHNGQTKLRQKLQTLGCELKCAKEIRMLFNEDSCS